MNQRSRQTIEDDLLRWYRNRIRTREEITTETDLLDSGYLDSLLLMELVVTLEEQFGIYVDSDEVSPQNFRSVRSLTNFVADRAAA
jgi:acyl carrier protein